ncbi:hypothetical protein [Ureibacillus thermosphaericus]|uniref:hypothetical protein n=1 Tax=Ureibacillus thermosphaericus TaxID=51173 RepID=UPI003BF46397
MLKKTTILILTLLFLFSVKDYKGVLTDVSFDEKGDNINAKLYLYKFDEATYPATYVGEISQ